jgi:uncharacterized protein (TIGR03067 family)
MSSAEQIHGVWQAVAAVISGQVLSGEEVEEIRLTLTQTRFTTQRGAETLFDSSYTADASKSPMQIEMVGTGGDFDGKAALGIYSLDGETLQLCYKMPGYPRPTEFASALGSGAFLITLRRSH